MGRELTPGILAVHIILIAATGLFAYSNTFNAPFQWDEHYFIVENPVIRNLNYFLNPSPLEGLEFYGTVKRRFVGYLTFALNYRLHGFSVTGYHIVNVYIHLLNALLVYFLAYLTFKTPFMENSRLKGSSGSIALFSALLFIAHPVQTEAVTYIFQRFASLAAFFYLLSLVLYIKWRQTPLNLRFPISNLKFYVLSLISAVLAVKTKENAVTLPASIALYEFLFFRGPLKSRALGLIPFVLAASIIPFSMDQPVGKITGGMESAIVGYTEVSRYDYLLTQFRVIVTYVRLLFLPVNQNVYYDYPISHSLLETRVLLSLVFIAAVLGLGLYLIRRSREMPDLRPAGFGVLWFFIALSVESSIMPLPMVIDEYRVYLPSAGAFTALAFGAALLIEKIKAKSLRKVLPLFVLLVPLALSCASYARNAVWRSEISLWEDIVKKSPMKPDGHNALGTAYFSEGRIDAALKHYLLAVSQRPDFAEAHNNLGNVYYSKDMLEAALKHYRMSLEIKPYFAGSHHGMGNVYLGKGMPDEALKHYELAVKLKPDYAEMHNSLGNAYTAKGLLENAASSYRTALSLRPDYQEAHYNLGVVYFKTGNFPMAQAEFETVLKADPDDAQARKFLDDIARKLNRR